MTDFKTEYDKLFIGGKWTEPSTSEVIEVHCPATGEYVGKVPMAAAADVDAAVAAARAAFDNGPWPSTPPKERAAVIANALKLMEERKDVFTKLLGRRDRPAADLRRDDAVDEWDRGAELLRRPRRRPGQMAGRSATAATGRPSSTVSRSAWWARSWRGTCRCSWRSTSWARRCWPAARWCSSRPPKPR